MYIIGMYTFDPQKICTNNTLVDEVWQIWDGAKNYLKTGAVLHESS